MRHHDEHEMHANSLAAYAAVAPSAEARRAAILRVYQDSSSALTDRQVMEALGFTDPNMVRPRITELVAAGKLIESGSIRPDGSRSRVRMCTTPTLFPIPAGT